jgi:sugar lactone lactonase YvrE
MPTPRYLSVATWRAVLLAGLVATLAACGGGGASPTPTPPPTPAPPLAGMSLLAGSSGGGGNVDGTGPVARFGSQFGIAAGADGTLYVADTVNRTIRKVTPAGAVSTLAGNGEASATDGVGRGAGISSPVALAVDGANNVYVADGSAIRKITPAGAVTTLAGQAAVSGASDGAGSDARFNYPQGVAVDQAGNVYVADSGNATVRKITPGGTVTTVAGAVAQLDIIDGSRQTARFYGPNGIAVDGQGGIYVSDFDGEFKYIRKLSATGDVSTLAKLGTGYTGRVNYGGVIGLSADQAGNVYLADDISSTVRKISADGSITILAGTAGVQGYADAAGTAARFQQLWGIAADRAGNLYVSDSSTLRKITAAGVVTTLAGAMEESGTANGTGSAARFSNLADIASDAKGNLIITEGALESQPPMHAIRMISPLGVVTTLAGSADKSGAVDGAAAQALFNNPTGVAADSLGNVYIADTGNYTIRKISPDGMVTTVAGSAGKSGVDDGSGATARFWHPTHLAVDGTNNVYVADSGSIRKITPGGVVTTLALSYGQQGIHFSSIAGMAADRSGNLYVSDTISIFFGYGSSTIRKITPAGDVITLAGTYNKARGNADGNGAAASFSYASGIAVGADGNVYVADRDNNLIRRIAPDGLVTTVAGQRGSQGITLGSLPGSLYQPNAMTTGPDGELYLTSAHAVLKLRF